MLNRAQTGLLVVDIQGKLARQVEQSERLIARSALLIEGANILDLPLIWLEQAPEKLGPTVEELRPLMQEPAYAKFTFSGLRTQAIADAIIRSGVQHWLVCGIEAHICVYQSARDLLARGAGVSLVCDAISARHPMDKAVALQQLTALGAHLTTAEMALYELLEDSRDPAFRRVLARVR